MGKACGAERLQAAAPWLVAATILVGAAVRLAHLPFSIDDTRSGGLFLAFAREIADNSYLLPVNIPHYTDGGLPFAYSPISFYLEAVLAYEVGIPDHLVVHVLPPVLAVLSLPSFHVLTGVMRLRPEVRLLALFVFAVSWAAFEHQVETGGLAESAGTLSLVWLSIAFAKIRGIPCTPGRWHILTGVTLGICIMASPGSAYASVVLAGVFSIWHMATARNLRVIAVVSVTCLLVIIPYVFSTLVHHGLSIITLPFLHQHGGNWFQETVMRLLGFSVLWGPHQAFAAKVAVASGVAHEIFIRRWWVVVWLIVCLLIPREGTWMASIPGSILAGVGIAWLMRLWLDLMLRAGRRTEAIAPMAIAIAALLLLGISAAGYKVHQEATSGSRLPDGFRETLTASASVLPADAKVVTLVESEDWSPFFVQRMVLNMPYGSEWQPNELTTISGFQNAMRSCDNLDCVHSLAVDYFGYRELYLVADRSRLALLCHEPSGCDSFELVMESENTVVGALGDRLQ